MAVITVDAISQRTILGGGKAPYHDFAKLYSAGLEEYSFDASHGDWQLLRAKIPVDSPLFDLCITRNHLYNVRNLITAALA